MNTLAFIVALSLAAPPVTTAAASVPDGTAAFEKLKKLEGSWKTDPKDGPVQYVTLRFVGAGISLLETSTSADRSTVNIAAVYAFEGPRLQVTHFGSGGTSRLDLVHSSDPAVIKFDGGGRDARVQSLVITVKENKLKQEWTTRENGHDVKKSVELLREYVDTLK